MASTHLVIQFTQDMVRTSHSRNCYNLGAHDIYLIQNIIPTPGEAPMKPIHGSIQSERWNMPKILNGWKIPFHPLIYPSLKTTPSNHPILPPGIPDEEAMSNFPPGVDFTANPIHPIIPTSTTPLWALTAAMSTKMTPNSAIRTIRIPNPPWPRAASSADGRDSLGPSRVI